MVFVFLYVKYKEAKVISSIFWRRQANTTKGFPPPGFGLMAEIGSRTSRAESRAIMKIYLSALLGLVVHNINKLFTGNLSASASEAKEEERFGLLKLDLQFFAEKSEEDGDDGEGDDDKGDDDDSDDDDDVPDFEELMKNKAFRQKHKERLEVQLDKRLKKFKDVDPDEYRRLKAAADKAKGNKGKDDKDDDDDTGAADQIAKKLLKVETREKNAAVKSFAIDKEVDPELLVRFINLKDIELDEDGEPENLEDLFDELLESKNAKYFEQAEADDDEDGGTKKKKKTSGSYTPGTKQKINKSKKVDPKEAGKQKAMARHKKKEE